MTTDSSGAIAQEFQQYPQQVHSSLKHPDVMYVRSPNYYAIHYSNEERSRTTTSPDAVAMLEDDTIGIFEGTPPKGDRPWGATSSVQFMSFSPVVRLPSRQDKSSSALLKGLM